MIKLRHLLTEGTGELTPRDIYNFYFLFFVSSYHPEALQTQYGKFIQDEYLKTLKAKYVSVFKHLIYEQIVKYVKLGRVDQDFPKEKLNPNLSGAELAGLMKKTFRSDMNRRNNVWDLAAEFLTKLETSTNAKDTFLMIDRLNAAVHNTQTAILGKVSYDLSKVYDKIHHSKSPNELLPFIDKDIRNLLDQKSETDSGGMFRESEPDFYGTADKKIDGGTPYGRATDVPQFSGRGGNDKKGSGNEDPKKDFKQFPLEERHETVKVSRADRENPEFMAGLKQGAIDKGYDVDRDLTGYSKDFIRGYRSVPQDSKWDKFNSKLTGFLANLGNSYGQR